MKQLQRMKCRHCTSDYFKQISDIMRRITNSGNACYSFKEQPLLVTVQLLQSFDHTNSQFSFPAKQKNIIKSVNFLEIIKKKLINCMLQSNVSESINPLNAELNPICYLLALLGAHHFLHVSRIRVKSLILRLLVSYIYGAPILDVSRSHTATQHSR